MQSLPCKDLKFDRVVRLDQILKTPDNSHTGYVVEVDIEYPQEVQHKFREYPPAPESIALDAGWFSEIQRDLVEKHGIAKNGKYRGAAKFIPHLPKHLNYVIH